MSEYMRTSQGLVHWRDYGGTGPLIVLVHGLGGAIPNWDAIGPPLSRLGHTVALDLPGFGLSPPGENWELETHAAAIKAFVSELGEVAVLIGNSMGALLSEMVAAEQPKLVDALVLLSPATPPKLPDPRIHWPTKRRQILSAIPVLNMFMMRLLMAGMTPEEAVDMSLDLVTHKRGRVPLHIVESFVDLQRARMELPWVFEAVPKTATSIARHWLPRSRFVAVIREIRSPTLVIHGLEDHIVSPTSVEWLCGLRPDWTLIQMEDTGHTPQIEAPVRLLSIAIPWLAQHLRREHTA